MDKKLIKIALSEAEKEAQEKTISEIKEVIKSLLTEIDNEEKKSKESLDKLKVLKRDLDDIKSGRLDKIEERQEKDPKQKEISTIYVERTKEYVPMYPWQSPWIVQTVYKPQIINNDYLSAGTSTFALGTITTALGSLGNKMTVTGTSLQNFSSGAYNVNNKIINL